jgi:hypothetical protein
MVLRRSGGTRQPCWQSSSIPQCVEACQDSTMSSMSLRRQATALATIQTGIGNVLPATMRDIPASRHRRPATGLLMSTFDTP